MTQPPENAENPADVPYESTTETAARRGQDDRRGTVNPADNPAPHSPAADDEAVRQGEERWDSVKPY